MKWSVTLKGVSDSGELLRFIEHAISGALSSTENYIADVSVTLRQTGKGQFRLKLCKVVIIPLGSKAITVVSTHISMRRAIASAIRRSSTRLQKRLRRQNTLALRQTGIYVYQSNS